MSIIWVYEYNVPSDNETNVELFASEEDAETHAIERIRRSLKNIYYATDPDSDHHDFFIEFMDMVNDGNNTQAISEYNDWVSDIDWSEQVFHNVYPKVVYGSSVVLPKVLSGSEQGKRTAPKVHFPNGATCKCGYHNEYVSESNQDDGTYLCGTCKALGGVFG